MSDRAKQLLVIALLAAGIVVAAIVISQGGSESSDDPAEDAGEVGALFRDIPQRGTLLGDPDAPVTVTEFADLQCPRLRALRQRRAPGDRRRAGARG